MKKLSPHTKLKTSQKAPATKPSPESAEQVDLERMVEDRYPSHDFILLATVASRLARPTMELTGGITRQASAKIAQAAMNLLDGVRDVFVRREESRRSILRGLTERSKIPEHLGWAAGKKFILGTDSGGSEERFYDFLKYRLRWEEQEIIRMQRMHQWGDDPALYEDAPATTPRQLNEAIKGFQAKGFDRNSLETLARSYAGWRPTVDKRRKKI